MEKVATKLDESMIQEIEKSGKTIYAFLQEAAAEKLLRVQTVNIFENEVKEVLQKQNLIFEAMLLQAVQATIDSRIEMFKENNIIKEKLDSLDEKHEIFRDKLRIILNNFDKKISNLGA